MKKLIAGMVLASLPLAGSADVVVTAFAQVGGYAIMYDEATQTEVARAYFRSGQATLDTTGIDPLQKYGVSVIHEAGQRWYSDVYWEPDLTYYKTFGIGTDYRVTALSGKVTVRAFDAGSVSVTLTANGELSLYNDDDYALDATIGLYRSATGLGELGDVALSKAWDAASLLDTDFRYETTVLGEGYEMISLYKDDNFYADYLGLKTGEGQYRIQFVEVLAGDAYDENGVNGEISGDGNDVTFTVFGDTGTLEDQTAYYVMLVEAWIYDEEGNVSIMGDSGLSLINPDYHAVPEAAVVLLLLGGGGTLIGIRRFFMD